MKDSRVLEDQPDRDRPVQVGQVHARPVDRARARSTTTGAARRSSTGSSGATSRIPRAALLAFDAGEIDFTYVTADEVARERENAGRHRPARQLRRRQRHLRRTTRSIRSSPRRKSARRCCMAIDRQAIVDNIYGGAANIVPCLYGLPNLTGASSRTPTTRQAAKAAPRRRRRRPAGDGRAHLRHLLRRSAVGQRHDGDRRRTGRTTSASTSSRPVRGRPPWQKLLYEDGESHDLVLGRGQRPHRRPRLQLLPLGGGLPDGQQRVQGLLTTTIPPVDKLLEDARTEFDHGQAGRPLPAGLRQLTQDEPPNLYLWQSVRFHVVSNKLHNVILIPAAGGGSYYDAAETWTDHRVTSRGPDDARGRRLIPPPPSPFPRTLREVDGHLHHPPPADQHPGVPRDHDAGVHVRRARPRRHRHRPHPAGARAATRRPARRSSSATGWTSRSRSATSAGSPTPLQGELGYRATSGTPVGSEVIRGLWPRSSSPGPALVIGILVGHPAGHPVGRPPVLEARLRADRHHVPGHLAAVVPARASADCGCSACSSSWSRSPGWSTVGQAVRLPRLPAPPGAAGADPRLRLHGDLPALHARRRCSTSSTPTTSPPRARRACRRAPSSRRHAFRNALIPVITLIGLSIPEMVGRRRRHRDRCSPGRVSG